MINLIIQVVIGLFVLYVLYLVIGSIWTSKDKKRFQSRISDAEEANENINRKLNS